jgi:hypothetical protein
MEKPPRKSRRGARSKFTSNDRVEVIRMLSEHDDTGCKKLAALVEAQLGITV